MRQFILLALIALLPVATPAAKAQNTRIESFKRAKKELRKIYKGSHPALYCGCKFTGRHVDRNKCGYKPQHNDAKAKRIHWEHVVPASAFGRNFAAWTKGHPSCRNGKRTFKGRKCARRASAEFRRMEADMHNLYPAEGELETARKNLQMGIIAGEKRMYGACDVEYTRYTIEPRPAVRGDIARAYLYMAKTYPKYMTLSLKQRTMFENWAKEDPVDQWEKTRNSRIAYVQGNSNSEIGNAKVTANNKKPPVARAPRVWRNGKSVPATQGGDTKAYGKYGKRIKHNHTPNSSN